jgi:hypothetical protein
MCIPHGATPNVNSGQRIKREKKVIKSISKVSKDQFEKGDPNFKDERVKKYSPESKEKKGWLATLLS